MNPMTATELQAWLKHHYPVENERHEWKEWRSLKHHVSGKERNDIISYVSALANMEGGVLIVGIDDRTHAIVGIEDFHDYSTEKLKFRLVELCVHLTSEGLRIEEQIASDTGARIWLVHVPKHAPRRPVLAHNKAWQRVGDSLVELRPERHQVILTEPMTGQDWSSGLVPAAGLQDIDPIALALAREKFAASNNGKSWASEIAGWSDAVFLDKARLSINGVLTHTALLLLGRPECVHLLSPHPAEIAWKLPAKRVILPYGPPFLLNVNEVLGNIRRHNVKLFPNDQLIATEVTNYDVRVILEALNNCIAHQDYERSARIMVIEHDTHLEFHSEGTFFDGTPADYTTHHHTPSRYRNKYLSDAMRELGLIDRGGFGISEMYALQRKRFLPLPDYELSEPTKVVVRIFGQTIDENYARLLMNRIDLPLEHTIWLDRVQKKSKVEDAHIAELRKAKLIEGRKPNWTVSASIAAATNSQNQYLLNKGLGDNAYKRQMLQRLEEFGPTSGAHLRDLIWDSLPKILTPEAKEIKVKNLRTALRVHGLDGKKIEIDPSGAARGPNAVWRIRLNN
jgi:ATP-dependent DNA helicase RecG